MSNLIHLLCFYVLCCCTYAAISNDFTIEISHSFKAESKSRGLFSVTNRQDVKPQSENQKNGIFDDESLGGFKNLLKNNDLYRIQIRTVVNANVSHFISTAIPACELQRSGFKEDLVLHLNTLNHPIGVSYSSPVIALSRPCDPSKIKIPQQFHTRIKIAETHYGQSIPLHAMGPVPPALQHVNLEAPPQGAPKIDQEKGPDGKPTTPPKPKTLIEKYGFLVFSVGLWLFLNTGKKTAAKK